jgi:hypothetical protein
MIPILEQMLPTFAVLTFATLLMVWLVIKGWDDDDY